MTETTPWPPIARSGRVRLSSPERTEKSGPHAAITWLIWSSDPDASFTDRKSTRLNSSHSQISYAVFCLKKKKKKIQGQHATHTKPLASAFTNRIHQDRV